MTYGYCRISTKQQSIERQIRNITAAYPDARIYQEAYTGTKIDRPQWSKLYKAAQAGDVIVFDSVSRMSRDASEGFAVYQELYNRGVNLVFLKEPFCNTSVYREAAANSLPTTGNEIADIYIEATNRVLMILAQRQIQLAFEQAEKEVDDLHQRTREGIQTARAAGKQIGQRQGAKLEVKKAAAAKAIIRQHSKAFGGSLSDPECMKLAGCSRNSFYKYKAELKAEAGGAA